MAPTGPMSDDDPGDFDEAYDDERAVFGEPYPALLELFERIPCGRVLDLGCGQGRNAVALAAMGHTVTALDSSRVGVAQAVAAGHDRGLVITGVVADIRALPVGVPVDHVVIDMVLHGLTPEEAHGAVESLTTTVRPGGTTYVVVPDPGPLADDIAETLGTWSPVVQPVTHQLTGGEHAGEYEFVSVAARRPG